MDFRAREDVEAPLEAVFAEITDFNAFERAIMRRGGDVIRLPGPEAPAIGAKWQVRFRMRGKERQVEATLAEADPAGRLLVRVLSPNIYGHCAVDLVALSLSRTRMSVNLTVKPKSLAARLFFQSLRFAKSRMTQRFKAMVLGYAEDIEARHRAAAKA